MGDAEIKASEWRMVQVGRIVLFTSGTFKDRLAAVVEIIDHKRILVDGPSSKESEIVPRHSAALRDVILTPLTIKDLPRAVRTGSLRKAWEKAEIEKSWEASVWAKKRDQRERRRALTDFERFKVMRLKKQSRFEIRKSFAKVRASAKS